jgi:hypothetical protein
VKQRTKIILVLAVGLTLSYRFIWCVDRERIFDDELNFGLTAIALGFLGWIVFKDRKQYFRTRNLSAFVPTSLGFFIGIALLTGLYFLHHRDQSPSKLYCMSKMSDFNGVSIDFREDGTYKLTSWSLGADYYRGTYTIDDKIIILDKSPNKEIIRSNRLMIVADGKVDSLGNIEQSIYQIKGESQIIKNAVSFRVLGKLVGDK